LDAIYSYGAEPLEAPAWIPGHGPKLKAVVFDASAPHLIPIYDPTSHLVYAANGRDVSDVVLDGKIIMRERKMEAISEEEILDKARWWEGSMRWPNRSR
jgi:hypothetical protein